MAGKLSVDPDGRVAGPASITYNRPWPCVNGQPGMQVPGGVMGVVMHTMVGNLPGTIAAFNRPGFNASAHFGIDQNGHIHQFGPVNGWMAWAEMDGNPHWYSIEHADNGNPDNPLTDAQLTASAQVVEVLSRHAGFPLREADTTGERGYGVHSMGGAAWGGHTCPDSPPRHIRSQQRPEILRRAQALRQSHGSPTPPGPGGHVTVVSDGTSGLAGLAAKHGSHPATILRITAEAALPVGEYVAPLATYVNTVFATDNVNMPDNLVLHYQEKWSAGVWRDFSWQ